MVGTIASVVDRRIAAKASMAFFAAAFAAAFIVGGLVGRLGELTGLSSAALETKLLVVLGVLVLGVATDAGRLHLPWPYRARQVAPGSWRHGPIRAAVAWGLELGTGLLTHVPSKALYAVLVISVFEGTLVGAVLYGMYGGLKGVQPLIATLMRGAGFVPPMPSFLLTLQRAALGGSVLAAAFGLVVWLVR